MSDFALDPRLQADTRLVAEWSLSQLLLMNDTRYPWFILVPRRIGIREIYQLSEQDQQQLWQESARLGAAAMAAFAGDKLNVAALGNLVPQLHLHHVVRYQGDPAWPAPVWGQGEARPYSAAEQDVVIDRLMNAVESSK